MKFISQLTFLLSLALVESKLIVDYHGGSPATALGNPEIEGQELGCHIQQAGNAAFIRPEADPSNSKPALHYHRDPHFRRTEVKALGSQPNVVQAGKTYYIGYNFRVSAQANSLVIFQWKKWDKNADPKQNIPLHLIFNSAGHLAMEYTIPGGNGSNRKVVWTSAAPFSVGNGAEHHIGMVINTSQNSWAELYVDGQKQKFNGQDRLTNVQLFTGPTSPKFGLYRAEMSGGGSAFCPANGIFTGQPAPANSPGIYNSWVYRVQISDASLAEVAEAAGVKA